MTLPSDMRRVEKFLGNAAKRVKRRRKPRLGAVIETPAAALAACEIVRHAQFLSFGTNDLTQYMFAADRENVAVDDYFDDTREVIFRMLKTVHDDVPRVPLSICGELAGRIQYTSKILDCGITGFSVAPPSIPFLKEAIRRYRSA